MNSWFWDLWIPLHWSATLQSLSNEGWEWRLNALQMIWLILWPQYWLSLWELCNSTSTHHICSCQLYEYTFSDCSPFMSTHITPNSWWRTALLVNFKSVTWLSAFTHDSDTQCRSALACLWPYVSFNWWVDSKNMFWGLRLLQAEQTQCMSVLAVSLYCCCFMFWL